MRIIIPPAKPLPRFEFTKEELSALVEELRAIGFGRAKRTIEHSTAFPKLDQFAFLAEGLEGE